MMMRFVTQDVGRTLQGMPLGAGILRQVLLAQERAQLAKKTSYPRIAEDLAGLLSKENQWLRLRA